MRQVPTFKIFTVVMCAELGSNILLPLLAFIFFDSASPLFSQPESLGVRSGLFGLCLGLYKIGGVIANICVCTLSDHFGRKMGLYATLIGLLLIAILGITALLTHSPWLLISGFFLGSLLDINKSVGPAIIADISQPNNQVKNMGMIQAVIAVGACLGPIIGGQFAHTHFALQTAYVTPFIIAGIIALIAMALVPFCYETLTIKSTHIKIQFRQIARDYWSLLKNKNIQWLFVLLILSQASWGCYYEFMPPTLKNIFNFSPAKVGIFMGAIAFWLIIAASIVIRFLSVYFNFNQLIRFATLAMVLGTLLSLLASEMPLNTGSEVLLWFSVIPAAMGDVILFSLIIGNLAKNIAPDQQGKAMGLTLIICTLIWSLIALLGGFLMSLYINSGMLFAPVGVVTLLLVLSVRPLKELRYDFVS